MLTLSLFFVQFCNVRGHRLNRAQDLPVRDLIGCDYRYLLTLQRKLVGQIRLFPNVRTILCWRCFCRVSEHVLWLHIFRFSRKSLSFSFFTDLLWNAHSVRVYSALHSHFQDGDLENGDSLLDLFRVGPLCPNDALFEMWLIVPIFWSSSPTFCHLPLINWWWQCRSHDSQCTHQPTAVRTHSNELRFWSKFEPETLQLP